MSWNTRGTRWATVVAAVALAGATAAPAFGAVVAPAPAPGASPVVESGGSQQSAPGSARYVVETLPGVSARDVAADYRGRGARLGWLFRGAAFFLSLIHI